ncbi:MAG: lipase family alpha/beta hydrolase [Burkholderiaceae bacterium]
MSDVRGLAQAGFVAAVGITDLLEAVHHTIMRRVGLFGPTPQGRTTGVTGLLYRSVRGTMRLVGSGLNAVLDAFDDAGRSADSAPGREAVLAILNGLWGDYLAESGNPLAIRMSLRQTREPLDLTGDLALQITNPRPRVVVLVHGLCMSDTPWRRHGRQLAALGYTPLYLRYNSGRHVSQNGRDFSELLERLCVQWPVPMQEVVIVGHSMGGLLARSACHHATEAKHGWVRKLTRLVFLGTPHHGAELERGWHLIDRLLGLSPYAAPFVRLGAARSAGLTDLRFGNLRDEDWAGQFALGQTSDRRFPTPLPAGVDAFMIAATLAGQAGPLRDDLNGDGLVPLASALGQHPDPAHALPVPASRQRVFYRANHWDLQKRRDVGAQLCAWLARPRHPPTQTQSRHAAVDMRLSHAKRAMELRAA